MCPDHATACLSDTPADSDSLCQHRDNCGFLEDAPCQCDKTCLDYGDCCSGITRLRLPLLAPIPTPGCVWLTIPLSHLADFKGICHNPIAMVGICPFGQAMDGANNCQAYKWVLAPGDGLPKLPISLTEMSAGVIGSKIIIFGDGDLHTKDNRHTLAFDLTTRSFEAVDARAKRPYWGDHSTVCNPSCSSCAQLRNTSNTCQYNTDAFQTEVYNVELYTFAGLCCQQFCSGCDATSRVQIYNLQKNSWRLGQSVPWEASRDGGTAWRSLLLTTSCTGSFYSWTARHLVLSLVIQSMFAAV